MLRGYELKNSSLELWQLELSLAIVPSIGF